MRVVERSYVVILVILEDKDVIAIFVLRLTLAGSCNTAPYTCSSIFVDEPAL